MIEPIDIPIYVPEVSTSDGSAILSAEAYPDAVCLTVTRTRFIRKGPGKLVKTENGFGMEYEQEAQDVVTRLSLSQSDACELAEALKIAAEYAENGE